MTDFVVPLAVDGSSVASVIVGTTSLIKMESDKTRFLRKEVWTAPLVCVGTGPTGAVREARRLVAFFVARREYYVPVGVGYSINGT